MKFLSLIPLLLVWPAFAASPNPAAYASNKGQQLILKTTVAQMRAFLEVDGTGGAGGTNGNVFITIYAGDSFTTNIFVTNIYATTINGRTIITSNVYSTNIITTNLFAQFSYFSNAFVTNLYTTNLTVLLNTTNQNLNASQYVRTDANKVLASTVDGASWTNVQSTNIFLNSKATFTTNYTVRLVDQVLYCSGTNQLLTLPNGTNGVPSGTLFSFLMSSATGYGSAIVTNANGVQTVLTAAALSQTITNGQSLTILWDGANWR